MHQRHFQALFTNHSRGKGCEAGIPRREEGGSSETSNMRERRRGEVRREAQGTTGGREDEASKTAWNASLGEQVSPATPFAASPVHHPQPPSPHFLSQSLTAGHDLGIRLRVADPVRLRDSAEMSRAQHTLVGLSCEVPTQGGITDYAVHTGVTWPRRTERRRRGS